MTTWGGEMTCPDCQQSIEIGDWPFPCKGRGHTVNFRDAGIHVSEKVVVLENKHTGEIRIPGRGDRPVHPKYAAQGYERRVVDTISGLREVERKTGTRADVLNYDKNSARSERDAGAI